MITKIATAAIYVEDQQRSKAFWSEKAGFHIVRETPMGASGSWIEVAPFGAETALVIYPRSMMDNWSELKPSLVFDCEDIGATYETMKRNGVLFQGEPKTMQWGTYVAFVDEEGNSFLLKG
ncbi:VOC family protein [Paenibacillus oceani]|uniref:VOC family protein n=1 Tax=Paenibacillus oceani TaxID=2772510 RepID=A0A927GX91_9BACL|nr:VOC family protein [Paenibacillus oceani]MBD2860566.1 VOC family protein [Paenibacillus oceani]